MENALTEGIEICELSERHVPELAVMEAKLFSMPWSENAFRQLLTKEYFHYLVALKGDKVIGFAGMTTSFGEGEIDKVMVDPEFQRRGVADALMTAVTSLGAKLGITAYTLEVRVSNVPAIRLYEKHGFHGEGVRPRFYERPTEDALIMWRREGEQC